MTRSSIEVNRAGYHPTQFTFLIGTGRCGSSLLHAILSRHPAVGFVSNLDNWIPLPGHSGQWNSLVYRRLPPSLTQGWTLRFSPSEGYRALSREVSPAVVAPFRDITAEDATPWLAQRFRDFFTVRAELQKTPLFLHKFTGWPRVGFIQKVFPEARFIHVLRDGRAVANSLLQTTWWRGFEGPLAWGLGPLPEPYAAEWERSGQSFVLLAGLYWKMLEDAAEKVRLEVADERWLQVKYEDLIDDPRSQLARVVNFLDLPWTATFEQQIRKQDFRQNRTHAYKNDLSAEQLQLLEESLESHLARYGY